ncbi:Calx-beta domain-containing protein [Paludisphaera rhizosphaerae]|uniref:Calx-beta domain-containing protein n=1 Tax=Paludisphaera rhizosphaerae TaxID=2711216 RepID=UPI0013EBD98E|nr:Calx-beta domain-containing protein [Paludisphaera rhizosphaerae]
MWRLHSRGVGRRTTRLRIEDVELERRQLLAAYYTPSASPFRVNQVVDFDQGKSTSAVSPNGVTTIVWLDGGQDGSGTGIYARRIGPNGTPIGNQFRVNTRTAGDQNAPAIGSDAQGNLVVIWREEQQFPGLDPFYIQRYDASGNAIGGNVSLGVLDVVADQPFGFQVLSDGGFVVLANNVYDLSGVPHHALLHFDAANSLTAEIDLGALVSDGWQFSSYYTTPAISTSGDDLVLAWTEERWHLTSQQEWHIDGQAWMRRIDLSGQSVGDDVLIGSVIDSSDQIRATQFGSQLTALSDGGFLLTWNEQAGSILARMGRRYNASGEAVGPDLDLGSGVASAQATSDGGMLVVTVQAVAFGDDVASYRLFDASGTQVRGPVVMTDATAYYMDDPALTLTPEGGFLFSWSGRQDLAMSEEIFAQAFGQAAVIGFTSDYADVNEGDGLAKLVVTRQGDLSHTASVQYATSDESYGVTARAGLDYKPISGVLTFAPGQASAVITIPIVLDSLTEPTESFFVALWNAAGAVLSDPAVEHVHILDDPSGTNVTRLQSLYLDRGDQGLWGWTPDQGLVQLNHWKPEKTVTSNSGRIFVDFGGRGLWTWAGGTGGYTLVSAANPENLLAAPDGSLYIDFGRFGLWRWNSGSLQLINAADPEGFAATADGTLYIDFGRFGLWRRDGAGLVRINAADPEGLAATPDGVLYVDFGRFGFWRRDGSGLRLVNAANPESILAAADGSAFVDFGRFGLWRWMNGFAQINGADPQSMAFAGGSLYADFGTFGLWSWKGGAMNKISAADAEQILGARDGSLYLDLGVSGVWRRRLDGTLELIAAVDPKQLIA